MRYHYQEGIVVKVNDELDDYIGLEILLKGGMLVSTLAIPRSEKIELGSDVYVSWLSEDEYPFIVNGKCYVELSAIEPKGLWKRKTHKTRLYKHIGFYPGLQAEKNSIRLLREAGIRTDRATPFEDECMGIDYWVFIRDRISNLWGWVPVDFTITNSFNSRRFKNKIQIAAERGVVLASVCTLSKTPEEFAQEFLAQCEEFIEILREFKVPLVSREYAMEFEKLKRPLKEKDKKKQEHYEIEYIMWRKGFNHRWSWRCCRRRGGKRQ